MLKRFLPNTLFWRFALIIFLPIVLLQALTIYIFYDRHWDTMAERLAESLVSDIQLAVRFFEETKDTEQMAYVVNKFKQGLNLYAVYIPDGKLDKAFNPKDLPHAEYILYRNLSQRFKRPFTVQAYDDYKQVQVNIAVDDGIWSITTTRKRLFSSTTYIFVLWIISLAILFTFLSMMFMRNQIRPMRRLAIAAENFGKGRNVPGFRPQGALEVRQAAEAFNVMRERLQRQITQRTEMLAGVSHDLRTPLTRLKLQLAMLKDSDVAKDMQSDVDEMSAMIDAYLTFAKGEGEEKVTRVDLVKIIKSVARSFSKQKISIKAPKQQMMRLRPSGIRRCITNIIGNAARFADTINITVKKSQGMVLILIDDNGPGIATDDYENAFKPFNRLDESRNLNESGVGLGLTVSRDIARGHGGDIELSKSPQKGLRVIVKLPL